MKLSTKTLNWLIISYVLIVLAVSFAMINTKSTLNQTWVLHIRLDHLLHVILFIPWMVLVCWRWREKKDTWFFLLALWAGLLLAAFSEGVQYLLPYRSFNVFDLLSNFVGLVIGGVISWRMIR
jgi:VanZ family protein